MDGNAIIATGEGLGNVGRKEKIDNNTSTSGVEVETESAVKQSDAGNGGIGGSVEPHLGNGNASTACTNTSSHATAVSNVHAHKSEDTADIRTLASAAKISNNITTGGTSMNLSKALRYAF